MLTRGASLFRRIFWPRIATGAEAVSAANIAMYACFVAAAGSAAVGLYSGGSAWFWVDVFMYAILGVGIRQFSRAAAILGFVFYGLSWLLVPPPAASPAILALSGILHVMVTLWLFQGIRAVTFLHTGRLASGGEVPADTPAATRLLWPLLRGPFFAALLIVATVNLMVLSSSAFVQQWILPTGSMEKTLFRGEHLVSLRAWCMGPVERGDLIAFRYPIDPQVVLAKRVVGIAGDRIRIANKQLFVNEVKVDEPYVEHITPDLDPYRDQFPSPPNATVYEPGLAMLRDQVRNGEVVVPAGAFFVLGDNRDQSLDSRYWGFVPRDAVLGRLILISYSSRPGRTMMWLKRVPLPANTAN